MKVIPIRKMDKNSTIDVTMEVSKEFRIRVAIASTLFHLGAWVLGCGCNFVTIEPKTAD